MTEQNLLRQARSHEIHKYLASTERWADMNVKNWWDTQIMDCIWNFSHILRVHCITSVYFYDISDYCYHLTPSKKWQYQRRAPSSCAGIQSSLVQYMSGVLHYIYCIRKSQIMGRHGSQTSNKTTLRFSMRNVLVITVVLVFFLWALKKSHHILQFPFDNLATNIL